jgi:hypothetical protein
MKYVLGFFYFAPKTDWSNMDQDNIITMFINKNNNNH